MIVGIKLKGCTSGTLKGEMDLINEIVNNWIWAGRRYIKRLKLILGVGDVLDGIQI